MPPKRKRPDRSSSDVGRPSPHRPAETSLGQRDRDGFDNAGRGGRGGRNTRRLDRRDSSQTYPAQSSSNNSQPASSPMAARHPAAASSQKLAPTTAPPPPSSVAPAPAPASTSAPASAPAPPPPEPPLPIPSLYSYENLTDDKIASWEAGSRQALVEHGIQSRQDVDVTELSSLFQEFIQSVVDNRLNPADAGACVKEILGPELKEVIKDSYSFEPHTLFLDTFSITVDNHADIYQHKFRDFLIATAISPALIRQVLEAPILQKLGLIRETFVKLGIRHSTNVLYRQANYNLLREESEGYSKLLTELFTTSYENTSTDVPTQVAREAFERIKALIGTFDLDVGRVLDVTLDVFATSLVKASRFFVKLLRVSSWWPRAKILPRNTELGLSGLPLWAVPDHSEADEERLTELKRQRDIRFWERARQKQIQAFFELGGREVSGEDLQRAKASATNPGAEADALRLWIETTQTLPPQGNRVAAQLLGFKLRFYASDFRDGEVLPANLLYLAALLIKIGFISIVDLYPHLWPYDDDMEDFKARKLKEIEEQEREVRGEATKNALLTAGALPDDMIPQQPLSRSREAAARSDATTKTGPDETEKEKPPLEQKGALVTNLLTIGALPEALFFIGRWPWLLEAFPDIIDRLNRILEYSVDKVYRETRPVAPDSMTCPPKQVSDPDQSGVPRGTIKRMELPVKKPMRWPWPDGRQGPADQQYRFYWDDWADVIPVCQTVDDIFTLCRTLLNVSGVNIGRSERLMVKLLEIGAKSLADDTSQHNLDRWQDLLHRTLAPALSTTKSNASISNLLWSLLRLYPVTTRYRIYAEWFQGPTARLPAMKKAFANTKAETQSTMKRISHTNLREMARTLAKTSHSSPGIVCKVALEQISSYGNLTDAVVECAQYFTDLSKDVLIWSLMDALGTNQRSRTQASYILSISKWLQALSDFTGKVFRRYDELDITPILRYVNDQLFHGNSTDLIILEELVANMGGIIQTPHIGEDQVMAMSGMALLQRHTLLSMKDKRFESASSAKRLTRALVDSRLAGRLLVNLAQFKQSASFRLPDDGAHIKFLSSMIDNSHQILLQYIDFLRAHLDAEDFDRLVPTISQLMLDFGLEAGLAFMIGRDSLATHLFSKTALPAAKVPAQPAADAEGDVIMGDDPSSGSSNATQAANLSPSLEPEGTTPDQPNGGGGSDAVQAVVESIRARTPTSVWKHISPEFFVIFWALQLGDLVVPWASYRLAQNRQQELFKQVSRDRTLMTAVRDAKAKTYQDSATGLMKEGQQHSERVAKAKVFITKRMDSWFTGDINKLNGISDAIIEQCLFPRLVLSKIDTEYSYALIRHLHELSCPNFRLMVLYDRLFKANRLRTMLFTCTVQEAENLGRFFHNALRDLAKWHKDSVAYEKEAIGKNERRPHGRFGFADTFGHDGQPTSHLDHARFQDLLYGWHKNLNLALKSCLSGTEWMHIRNAITFLTEVHQFFPAIKFMGSQFQQQLEEIGKREENSRGDLSTTARGVLTKLAKMEKTWVIPAAFRTNLSAKNLAQAMEDEQAAASNLRPSAPEFQPRSTTGDKEDGEVRDTSRDKTQASNAGAQRQNLPPATTQKETTPASNAQRASAATANAANNEPSNQKQATGPAAAQQATTNTSTIPNRGLANSHPSPNLPSRPPGPIPDHRLLNHFRPAASHERRDVKEHREAQGHRDVREQKETNREFREPRDLRDRDTRVPEPARTNPPRDFPNPERRVQDTSGPAGASGRSFENERNARQENQHGRRGEHAAPDREAVPPSCRTADAVRPAREGSSAVASAAGGDEPPMNPARAALIQGEAPTRADRVDRHDRVGKDRGRPHEPDRRGRGQGQGQGQGPGQQMPEPGHDRPEMMNAERAALFQDGRPQPPSRPPRDEVRDRGAIRASSPRPGPGGRHHPDATGDMVRDDSNGPGRPPYADRRGHPRESRGEGPPGPHARSTDGDREDRPAPDNNTREAFLGRSSDHDHGRPRQDDTYGRLNYPIQSVVNDVPSGPRGRGSRPMRGNANALNTPPPRMNDRFQPRADNHAGIDLEERNAPSGPAGSGRGTRSQFATGPGSVGPSHPPGPTPDRGRQNRADMPASSPRQPGPETPVVSGVHPDRLAQISGAPPPPPGPGSSHGPGHHTRQSQLGGTPDRQPVTPSDSGRTLPRHVHVNDSPAPDMAPPTGPAASSSSDRRRGGGRRQLEGINSMLQQAQDPNRSSIGRGRSSRVNLANSDAQVLTGGSPVTTPSNERSDPVRQQDKTAANAEERVRGERERGRDRDRDRDRDRERGDRERERGRESHRERERDRDRGHRDGERPSRGSRRSSRDRSLKHEQEHNKDSREYRDRQGTAPGGREESRRSALDTGSTGSREAPEPAPHGREAGGGGRESRHRSSREGAAASASGSKGEDWGGSMRGHPRGGPPRDRGLRTGDERRGDAGREGGREDRGRKRRSEDAAGFPTEKRPRR
ncbi:hypothetical protein SODALDRAFT_396360 [Sodiomyces alkalinus F11]|uniref:THO complex subunit 2 n=1 Tax=Sodiomyces alkalinus (strain CBS 110278 / VKM F-3762 / F11) TaxID=1314773 RepID=A0A3N2Q1X2_SODAK|nr:hypothetical protein SODALDRAFT_396360 [Sodiomyces alkalinus F11]ROT40747.1 hypothetical protein SODALDRAFT_396360 [Sodiomyces alkalinus F11]